MTNRKQDPLVILDGHIFAGTVDVPSPMESSSCYNGRTIDMSKLRRERSARVMQYEIEAKKFRQKAYEAIQ